MTRRSGPIATVLHPIRVLQLTDPHLLADTAGSLRGTVTHASLSRVVAHYRRSDWRADLVVLTGDVVQDYSARAYEHCRALLEPLELPVYCLPGNHDSRELMRAALSSEPFFYCEPVDIGSWRLVGIDSCAEGRHDGEIADRELDRMEACIREARERHVLVLLHHPPVQMHSEWLDRYGLVNAPQFLDRIDRHSNVRGIVFGHVHQCWDSERGPVRIIGSPSTCAQFAPRRSEFTIDDKPPAYRSIELQADGGIATEVIWVNDVH